MRVGMFTTLFPSKPPFEFDERYQWGGVSEVVYNLSLELDDLGHEVSVFSVSNDDGAVQRHGNVTVYRFPKHLELRSAYLSLCHLVEPLASELDLVHVHRGLPSGALAGTLHSVVRRTPTVVTVHGTMDPGPLLSAKGVLLRGFNLVSPWLLSRADAVTTVTEGYRRTSPHLSGLDDVEVIPNGVSAVADRPAADEAKRAVGVDPETTVVLFVGQLIERKRPDLLPELAHSLPRHRPRTSFVIIGDGPMREDLARDVVDLGVEGSVRLLGFVDESTRDRWYRAADIFCLPSRDESFGLTALEASARGAVPVVSDLPCFRDYIDDGENGLVVDASVTAFRDAVRSLVEQPGERRRMAKHAVANARTHDWTAIAEQYLDVYASVV